MFPDNFTNLSLARRMLDDTFANLTISSIDLLGSGYDSVAYLVNQEYVFKIKFSVNKKQSYAKEKAIYDFLNKYMKTKVSIPNIEYSYLSGDVSILGYKKIKGKFLTPAFYKSMTEEEQQILKEDIAIFLRQMHNLDITPISQYTIDNKENVLEEYQLLKDTIYNTLTDNEKKYIERFMNKLSQTSVFNDRKCLCHNDFSSNHILLDDKNRLCGVIDFGDAGIIDEYADFIYLLEDSEEEIGHEFGDDILKIYGNIDIKKAHEYQDLTEDYYPIETIIYGLKNNKQDFIDKGKSEINRRLQENKF